MNTHIHWSKHLYPKNVVYRNKSPKVREGYHTMKRITPEAATILEHIIGLTTPILGQTGNRDMAKLELTHNEVQ